MEKNKEYQYTAEEMREQSAYCSAIKMGKESAMLRQAAMRTDVINEIVSLARKVVEDGGTEDAMGVFKEILNLTDNVPTEKYGETFFTVGVVAANHLGYYVGNDENGPHTEDFPQLKLPTRKETKKLIEKLAKEGVFRPSEMCVRKVTIKRFIEEKEN